MRTKKDSIEWELSSCEKPIMKIVWFADGDIALQELIEQLRIQFGKDYARTTVATFLKRLSDKGFVSTYRKGVASYVHPEITLESYRDEVMRREAELWYGGRLSSAVSTILRSQKVSREEIRKMKEMLDVLDD